MREQSPMGMVAVWRVSLLAALAGVWEASPASRGRVNYGVGPGNTGTGQNQWRSPTICQLLRDGTCRTGKYTSSSDLRWLAKGLRWLLVVALRMWPNGGNLK